MMAVTGKKATIIAWGGVLQRQSHSNAEHEALLIVCERNFTGSVAAAIDRALAVSADTLG
ncbi:hypothetical protein GZ77_17730 [Endozoicomonas montiporae]|uniref:Uncharacterized protein n=2 Tax=Endozoicomonas montiporae TaxID=1027273 RepID=A0A081N1Q8_9GAMM|nr:hypothetical protein GZ77_17730 [Endozoicomonas montiporae]